MLREAFGGGVLSARIESRIAEFHSVTMSALESMRLTVAERRATRIVFLATWGVIGCAFFISCAFFFIAKLSLRNSAIMSSGDKTPMQSGCQP